MASPAAAESRSAFASGNSATDQLVQVRVVARVLCVWSDGGGEVERPVWRAAARVVAAAVVAAADAELLVVASHRLKVWGSLCSSGDAGLNVICLAYWVQFVH